MTGSAGIGDGGIVQVSHDEGSERAVKAVSGSHGLNAVDVNVGHVGIQQSVSVGVSGGSVNDHAVCLAQVNGYVAVTELNVLVRIVLAKNHNGSVGVDLVQQVDGLGVVDLEAQVAVEVRLSGEGQNIQNRDLNGVVGLVAQSSSQLGLVQHIGDCGQILGILLSEENVNHVDGVRNGCGDAGSQQLSAKLSAGVVNQSHVLLTNQSGPIHLGDGLAGQSAGLSQLVDVAVHEGGQSVLHCCASVIGDNSSGQLGSVGGSGESQLGVEVEISVAQQLLESECAEVACVVTQGNQISLSQLLDLQVVPSHVGELTVAELEVISQHLSVQVAVTGDGNVVGILGHGVLAVAASVQVSLNQIPSVLVVLVNQVDQSDQSILAVGQQPLAQLDAVVLSGVAQDLQNGSVVSDQEVAHLLAAVLQVVQHDVGGVVEPLDDPCNVSIDVSGNVGDEGHDVCVSLGQLLLDVGVRGGDDGLNGSDGVCDSGLDVALQGLDEGVQLLVGDLDLVLSLSDSGGNLGLNLSDSGGQVSLDLSDSVLDLGVDAVDLSQDGVTSGTDSGLQLLVEDSQLLLSLSVESDDLLPSLSVQDGDLLLGVSVHLSDVGIQVLTGIHDSGTQQGSDISGVGSQGVQQSQSVGVGLGIQLISVVQQGASGLDGDLGVVDGRVQSGSELLASDEVSVLSQPSLSVSDGGLGDIQVAVSLDDQTGVNSLPVSDGVSLVVVLLQQLGSLKQVLEGLVLGGVLGLVSLYDSSEELVVSGRGGMDGHTVADLEQSVDLNHGLAGLGSVEPLAQRGANDDRSGRVGLGRNKLGRDITESVEHVTGGNTHQTVNGDLQGINVHSDCILNRQVDAHRNLFVNVGGQNCLDHRAIRHVGNSIAIRIQNSCDIRISGLIHQSGHEDSFVAQHSKCRSTSSIQVLGINRLKNGSNKVVAILLSNSDHCLCEGHTVPHVSPQLATARSECAKVGSLGFVCIKHCAVSVSLLLVLSCTDPSVTVGSEISLEGIQLAGGNLGKSLFEHSHTDHLGQLIVVSIDLSATNDSTGQAAILATVSGSASGAVSIAAVDVVPAGIVQVVEGLNDELGSGLLGIVEGSVSVGLVNHGTVDGIHELLGSRNTGDVAVQQSEHLVHHSTELELEVLTGDGHTVGGVHQTDQNDLNVGVQLDDSIQNCLIVEQEACHSVGEDAQSCLQLCLGEAFHSHVGLQLSLEISVDFQNNLLSLLGLQDSQSVLEGHGIIAQLAAHQNVGHAAQQVSTEGSVADAEGHDVSISDSVLVVIRQLCDSLGRAVFSIATLAVLAGIGVVQNLLEPAVGGLLAAAQEVQQILSTESGSSQLGVVHLVALTGEVLLELESVRACAVHVITLIEVILTRVLAVAIQVILVTLVIAVEAIAIGHGVTDRNVMNLFVSSALVGALGHNRDHGSANGHEHGQNQEQGKSLLTHSREFHDNSFLNVCYFRAARATLARASHNLYIYMNAILAAAGFPLLRLPFPKRGSRSTCSPSPGCGSRSYPWRSGGLHPHRPRPRGGHAPPDALDTGGRSHGRSHLCGRRPRRPPARSRPWDTVPGYALGR